MPPPPQPSFLMVIVRLLRHAHTHAHTHTHEEKLRCRNMCSHNDKMHRKAEKLCIGLSERCKWEKSEEKIDCHLQDSNQVSDALTTEQQRPFHIFFRLRCIAEHFFVSFFNYLIPYVHLNRSHQSRGPQENISEHHYSGCIASGCQYHYSGDMNLSHSLSPDIVDWYNFLSVTTHIVRIYIEF